MSTAKTPCQLLREFYAPEPIESCVIRLTDEQRAKMTEDIKKPRRGAVNDPNDQHEWRFTKYLGNYCENCHLVSDFEPNGERIYDAGSHDFPSWSMTAPPCPGKT